MHINEFLSHFNGVKNSGDGQYKALCPAHADDNASLSINDDGEKILINCFAGCKAEDVLSSAGLKLSDLYNKDSTYKRTPSSIVYSYGTNLRKTRYYKNGRKFFYWEHKEGNQWVKGLGGQAVPLYNQEVLESIEPGATVFIVEGEKDTDTMKKINLNAVSSPNGATQSKSGKKWEQRFNNLFEGLNVVILPDNDKVGKDFANLIAENLYKSAHSVKILDLTKEWHLANKQDITDVYELEELGNGKTVAQTKVKEKLLALCETTPLFEPATSIEPTAQEDEEKPPFYKAMLIQDTVEQILEYKGLKIAHNQATNKVVMSGEKYDEIFGKLYSKERESETLLVIIQDTCKLNKIKGIKKSDIEAYLNCIADKNRFNPVIDMLKEYQNDNPENYDAICKPLHFKEEFDHVLFKKWCIQAVAYAFTSMSNLISAEGILVLYGTQGVGKTSLLRKLSVYPSEWFVEGASININDKDSISLVTSGWITELGELDNTFRKSSDAALKSFITNTIDTWRPPYGKANVPTPRHTALCGTVNTKNFLRDPTGSRRYWVIEADDFEPKYINKVLTEEDIKKFWGYIYNLYLQDPDEGFRLDDAQKKKVLERNRNYEADEDFEAELMELFCWEDDVSEWKEYSPTEIAAYIDSQRINARRIGLLITNKLINRDKRIERRRTSSGMLYKLPLVKSSAVPEKIYMQWQKSGHFKK